MTGRIPYTRPSITALEVAYATDAAANGWGERCYAYIQQFERDFASYLGVEHAIATSSCTGALHIGLAALGIGPGDEVILADTNWIATVAPIRHLGASPVLVDILPETWCIDPEAVARAITPRTKAIVATHLYGNLCDMTALLALGERHGVPVIEDAAEAIGSRYHGAPAGSLGLFGTFSFHGTKTLSTGEGGMLVTKDPQLAERMLTLSNHGRARGEQRQFWPERLGFKYKMSNLQAAIGCAQLERVDTLVARKRQILDYYRARLEPIEGLVMNAEPAGMAIGAWMPTAVLAENLGVSREDMVSAFARHEIDARVFFHPLSSLPMFQPQLENIHAWSIPQRAINLPSYHDMSDAEQDRVIAVLLQLIEGSPT